VSIVKREARGRGGGKAGGSLWLMLRDVHREKLIQDTVRPLRRKCYSTGAGSQIPDRREGSTAGEYVRQRWPFLVSL